MQNPAYWFGALIGGAIIFPIVIGLLLLLMRKWQSSMTKYLVAGGITYLLAAFNRAIGHGEGGFEDRLGAVVQNAQPLIDLPMVIIVTGAFVWRARRRARKSDG